MPETPAQEEMAPGAPRRNPPRLFSRKPRWRKITRTTPRTPRTGPWLAGEVLHTYAIVERGDEVWLIDKHAAHERMNFDRLKAMHHSP